MTMMWSNDGEIISVVQIDQRDPDYLEIAGDDNDNDDADWRRQAISKADNDAENLYIIGRFCLSVCHEK